MPTQIVMPQLGESVAEGVIGKWLKAEGDPIAKDEPIVEVVTDKVNAEIPSPVAGVLEKISAAEGATVLVGQEIAVIGDGQASVSPASNQQAQSQASATQSSVSQPASDGAASAPVQGLTAQPTPSMVSVAATPGPAAPSNPPQAAQTQNGAAGGVRHPVRSSPLVQRLAAENNIDLSQVPGTGIGGRVSKRDILHFIESSSGQAPTASAPAAPPSSAVAPQRPAAPAPAVGAPTAPAPPTQTPSPARPAPAPPTPGAPAAQPGAQAPRADEEYVPISPVRRMIAEHMVKSKFTIPHATSMIEVDMTPVVKYRDANKAEWQSMQGISLSFMAFVALATIESLRQHPLVNSEWGGDKIVVKKNINLGLAVAAQNGLIVPNIKNADRLSLGGLAHAINDLTVRARTGKLTPDDVSGGTFTLNNTGAIGSVWSVSVINYPQAGILSADAIVKRVRVLDDDSIAIRHMMNLCMSFDHRTLDGATVSDFLQFIRRRLEGWSEDCPL